MIRTLRRLAIVLALLLPLGLLSAPPAAAYADYVRICNSTKSVDDILAYTTFGPYVSYQIDQGTCRNIPDSYNGVGNRARVDVDITSHEGYVRSYWKIKGTESSYTSKTCSNGDNYKSDPWSEYYLQVTTYDTNGVYCP